MGNLTTNVSKQLRLSPTILHKKVLLCYAVATLHSLLLVHVPERVTHGIHFQGLFLDTNGDQLIGRAENGFMWLWDMSAALGWYRDSSSAGSWLRDYTRRPAPVRACSTLSLGALRVAAPAVGVTSGVC